MTTMYDYIRMMSNMAVDRGNNQSLEPNYKKMLTAIGLRLMLRMNRINEGNIYTTRSIFLVHFFNLFALFHW